MAKKSAKKKSSRPTKPGQQPAAKRKVVADREVSESSTNHRPAPNQPPLTGLEDTDERVPELETLCQKVLADREKKSGLADAIVADLEEIGDLLGEHGLDCYIVSGRKFFISPAESHVKITKVKQG